jgi:hypothetical protein
VSASPASSPDLPGELKDRRYDVRMDDLADFDPFTDIALAPGGAWCWSSDRPEFHNTVRRYFHERDEDGEGIATAVTAPGAATARP